MALTSQSLEEGTTRQRCDIRTSTTGKQIMVMDLQFVSLLKAF